MHNGTLLCVFMHPQYVSLQERSGSFCDIIDNMKQYPTITLICLGIAYLALTHFLQDAHDLAEVALLVAMVTAWHSWQE